MPIPAAQLGIFTGGQMTDLPAYPPGRTPDGTELLEIVAPGNAADGVNYAIPISTLSLIIVPYVNTIITTGATIGSPYQVPTDVSRALFNKTVGSATYVVFDASANYGQPVLIRDLKGDADVNNITISFTGGELCDGLTTLVISNPYGGYILNPLASGWYMGFF